MEDSAFSQVN